MVETLFSLEIPGDTAGSFTCTLPQPKVYLLTFTSAPDNRLTTAFCSTFLLALDIVQHRYPRGILITTSGISKFYSNGLDLDHVAATPGYFVRTFYPLQRRLLTFNMPTLALINGHAFAGGLILAMHHDYRFQNPSKGYLCMNEVHFGALMETPMISIFREKVTSAQTFRTLLLEGHRFPAQQALQDGLVDGLGGLGETMAFVEQRQLIKMAESGIYGQMKEDMYRQTIHFLDSNDGNLQWRKLIEITKRQAAHATQQRLDARKTTSNSML